MGWATGVSEAQIAYVQWTYMEASLPASVGAARKAVRGEGSRSSCGANSGWVAGWATSISEACAAYVHTHIHGGVAPGVVMGPAVPVGL